jgi:hypothetical protein
MKPVNVNWMTGLNVYANSCSKADRGARVTTLGLAVK